MGSSVTVKGYGFGPFEPVEVSWDSPSTELDSKTDMHGSGTIKFAVPLGAASGLHTISSSGRYLGLDPQVSFTVQ